MVLKKEPGAYKSTWDRIKRDPKRPTLNEMKKLIVQLGWLKQFEPDDAVFVGIPDAKIT